MIIHDCLQRTPQWQRLRMGMPTASSFDKILTSSGRASEQAQSYMCRLLAERIIGRPLDDIFPTKWMEHGSRFEGEALNKFEESCQQHVETVGFVTTDDGKWGCSPDGVIKPENAAVEIKCPSPWKQMQYLLYGRGKEYRTQVQGQMLVGEYDQVYFFSYFPGMPPVSILTPRDDKFINVLRSALLAFSEALDRETERVRKMGAFDPVGIRQVLENIMPMEEE